MKRYLLLVCAALAVFSAACGGGDKKEMESTVKTFVDAINSGNPGNSYDVFAKTCRDKTTKAQYDQFITQANTLLKSADKNAKLELTKFEVVEQSGNNAKVRSTYRLQNAPREVQALFPTEPQDATLVKEDGKWRTTDCIS